MSGRERRWCMPTPKTVPSPSSPSPSHSALCEQSFTSAFTNQRMIGSTGRLSCMCLPSPSLLLFPPQYPSPAPPPPTRLHHPIPHTESRVFSLHEIGYDLLNSCLVKCLPSPSPPLPSTSVSPHPPSALTIPLRTQQPTATSTVMK